MREDATLAVSSLSARLFTDTYASSHQMICQPVSQSLVPGFPARSTQYGPHEHRVDLRFFLTQAEVEDIEQRRHSAGGDVFTLYLGIEAVIAGFRPSTPSGQAGSEADTVGRPVRDLFAGNAFLDVAGAPGWVRSTSRHGCELLPGLGYDRVRLIEMTSAAAAGHGSAAAQFDKARRALDERRYGACISECRGLLTMWEKQHGATSKRRIAEVIGDARSWAADDIRATSSTRCGRRSGTWPTPRIIRKATSTRSCSTTATRGWCFS